MRTAGSGTARSVETYDVLIVGGGNAGVSLAARLLRLGVGSVAIVEPEPTHVYRPLLNYVGGGQARLDDATRPAADVAPPGVTWVADAVVAVDVPRRSVSTRDGRTLGWGSLVVCPGLEEDWDAVPGLQEAYGAGWAGSTFLVDAAARVARDLAALDRGTVVFSVPPDPAPCAATALKPLTLAVERWRRAGHLDDLDLHLVLPEESVTGVEAVDRRLDAVLERAGVRVHRRSRVERLECGDGPGGRRVVVATPTGSLTLHPTYAHVVPPYRAPDWIRDADLADGSSAGLLALDPETLQHRRHASVWGLGDVSGAPPRPSGGALRKQVPVLAHNLLVAARGGAAEELRRYDGYTVMPVTTGRRHLLLVEVDRAGHRAHSVPRPLVERPGRLLWAFDRYVLPQVYFRRILRGRA